MATQVGRHARRVLAATVIGLATIIVSAVVGGAGPESRSAVAPTTAAAAAVGSAAIAGSDTGAPSPPGVPASPETTAELQRALGDAVRRFEAKDVAGVLAHVSEQYRTSPLTKPLLREQLGALFGVYEALTARIRIDDVRMVGEHAWVYSTGEVSGRLPLVGRWMPVLGWQRELEVARREGGRWRLYGYQR